MFDATSPSDRALGARPAILAGNLADGRAEIGVIAEGERTRLRHLYQHEPMRVLFPTPATGDCLYAALVTTSGGVVGGDRLSLDVQAASGTRVLVSPQAAEKVYRSTGADCRIEVSLTAEAASWLEFLPQETILFDGARLARVTRIEADPEARVFAGEMLVFGRVGRGERLTKGFVRDSWEIRRDGSLIWADTLLLDGDVAAPLAHPAGFDGATACATAIYVGSDAGSHVEVAREALVDGPNVRCGATVVNDVLVARFLAVDPRLLREAFAGYWRTMRHRLGGLPPRMPQLWHI